MAWLGHHFPGEKKLGHSNAGELRVVVEDVHPSYSRNKTSIPPSMSDSLHLPIPIAAKFPRHLTDGGVGLGIVAAMNNTQTHKAPDKLPALSGPVPIVKVQGAKHREKPVAVVMVEGEEGEEGMELSESYTCVISRARDDSVVSKMDYLDHGNGGVDAGVVFELGSPPPLPTMTFPMGDLLSYCFLCNKCLHGLDAFIYRGETAFCSPECRYQHMVTREEFRERNVSEVTKHFSCSASPCSAHFPFSTGLAAA